MVLFTRKDGHAPRPTSAELDLLQVLWDLGPSTVRQVFEVMAQDQSVGYTTVLKTLQIMHQKGLVERDDSERAHIYQPSFSKEHTQRQLLSDFMGQVFDGSATQLVMQALGTSEPASREELARIRELLDLQLEGGKP
jgi:predicted transcriptional regulator